MGVFNTLKSSKTISMCVQNLLQKVEWSDQQLEADLSIVLQSVRGTKQHWFLRESELQCMVREWGSPTFFITFSCAEYHSVDIVQTSSGK